MDGSLKIKMYSVTLDCKDPHKLAGFYAKLLGWETVPIPDEVYVVVAPPGTVQGAYPGITFQRNDDYIPPVWPEEPGAQQQMAHIDFVVNDVEKAVKYALDCGATVAEQQFSDAWTVMLDPSGHPFCLCGAGTMFESPGFALL
ncbi:MAG: VOC family protein [Oscillospiraceae bacterium]|jgi:catechol 2,3-dioxygenase-like lactoylglutathione lyase family enzyme|nr:VOC family protein [Oscillospiraceae bacterium]